MSDFFTWDDEVTSDGAQFIALRPGKYVGKVTAIDKKIWSGGGKMTNCPMAEVKIEVDTNLGKTFVTDRIFLSKSMEWKIGQFLYAFGLKKKGEAVKASSIINALGKQCEITVGAKHGKEFQFQPIESDEDFNKAEENGWPIFNEIKKYSPLQDALQDAPQSDPEPIKAEPKSLPDSEFGF